MTGPRAPSFVPLLLGPLLLLALVLGLSAAARPARPAAPPLAAPPAAEVDLLGRALRATEVTSSLAAASTTTAPVVRQDAPREDGWGDDWLGWHGFVEGARVRGLVLGADGLPQGEVAVEVRADPAGETDWPDPWSGSPLGAVATADELLARGRTGPDGAFVLTLDGPVPASCGCLSVTARAHDGGLAVAAAPFQPAGPEGLHDLGELRLRPARRLTVLAVGAGQPLADASVALTVRGADRTSLLLGRTDAAGALAVDLYAEATEAELVVRLAGRASARRELGPLPRSVEVELAREAVLWGRVVDARGRPVARASITARPVQPEFADASGETDDDGRFVIGGLAHGVGHDVQARPRDGESAPVDLEVALPSPELLLRLEVPGAVLVTLVPPRPEARADRAWLSGVELELLRAGPSGAWRPATWHEREPSAPSPGALDDHGDGSPPARSPDGWGDDWGEDRGSPPASPPAPPPRQLGADQRLLLGLAPGRYWVRARDPWSQAASAPVELLVSSGAEETVTLVLEP